ncbi:LacI family DNA-binding transcriptional regulator [Agarivorans gilvus]|uniref:LacI family transcriptional regulator n=1 Tax=Agarivorans gilvus TaxID=680279 RepID=A0ABQ1HVU3_9ALTE|nr:LacI family DNA-binding transcriptional regulator [Agarivorans gilvus]GGA93542.1 LacI family transcriptional regulator [Agarivorans gilvus]
MKTIANIAEMAGVSKSTVSRVLNKRPGVNATVRAKVQALIDESNFTANIAAKNLKARNSDTIGIIVPLLTSKSVAAMVQGFSEVIETENMQTLLMNAGMQVEKTNSNIKTLNSKGVDGIIVLMAEYNQELIETLKQSAAPVVIVGQDLSLHGLTSVFFDDYRSGFLAGTKLTQLDCKKLMFIGVPQSDVAVGRQRLRGFVDAVDLANIECHYQTNCDFSLESGYQQAKLALNTGYRPDGVFAVTDRLAAGTIKALRECGLTAGKDVAVIGVGDDELCTVLEPPLASVHYDYVNMGKEAASVLIKQLRDKPSEALAFSYQGRFAERESYALAGLAAKPQPKG